MSRNIGLSFDLSMNNKKFSRTILAKDRQPHLTALHHLLKITSPSEPLAHPAAVGWVDKPNISRDVVVSLGLDPTYAYSPIGRRSDTCI